MRYWPLVVLALLEAVPTLLAAQEVHTRPLPSRRPAVRGMLRDKASGAPVGSAPIRTSPSSRIASTDTLGRYVLYAAPVGRTTLTFFCPTRRFFLGRMLTKLDVEITATTDSVVDVYADTGGCVDPPLLNETREFAGRYSTGFEASDYVPCEGLPIFRNTSMPDRRPRAWLLFERGATSAHTWPEVPEQDEMRTYFLRVRGVLTGPGMYGHLGVNEYQFMVHEVLEIRAPRNGDCGA